MPDCSVQPKSVCLIKLFSSSAPVWEPSVGVARGGRRIVCRSPLAHKLACSSDGRSGSVRSKATFPLMTEGFVLTPSEWYRPVAVGFPGMAQM